MTTSGSRLWVAVLAVFAFAAAGALRADTLTMKGKDKQTYEGLFMGFKNDRFYFEPKGAYTGEVSVSMLTGLVDYVIVGHSERRQIFGETDQMVNRKVQAVLANGLLPILCMGETLAENEAGQTEAVLERQTCEGLANIGEADLLKVTIAYEPIWAIGTGRNATADDAQQVCALPQRTPQPFEVALNVDAPADRARLEAHGWRLVSPLQMSLDIFG